MEIRTEMISSDFRCVWIKPESLPPDAGRPLRSPRSETERKKKRAAAPACGKQGRDDSWLRGSGY